MTEVSNFINQLPEYTGVFLLMLSTFLIGYFSAYYIQKNKYKRILKKIKRKYNALKMDSHNAIITNNKANNIETIFSEIKPKIVEAVKEAQEELLDVKSVDQEEIAAKTSASYLGYTQNKPKLDFDLIGKASPDDRDDLTQINGIGPYIEQRLNEIGIYTYEQISKLQPRDIRTVTQLIDFFPDRIERDRWVEQAQQLLVKH
jgi:predicted flap endonuclease-1-like 5' DNA nuclease